jgi:peptidoglycan/xylan/chitin deacetylase (PgdA/CDA1 family)
MIMKREFLASLCTRSGLCMLALKMPARSGIICLNYHRIGNPNKAEHDRGLFSATADDFDAQVGYVKSHFDIVSPDDLDICRRKSGRYALITFDDGYLDNYDVAFPILRRHGAVATFFISTGFLDCPRLPWWDEVAWMVRQSARTAIDLRPWLDRPVVFDEPDRENAVRALLRRYKALPSDVTDQYLCAIGNATGTRRRTPEDNVDGVWMTWDMVREMRAAGMSVGGHTVSHPVLSRMPRERQLQEIEGCGRRIVEELGESMAYFSYPVGGPQAFNDDTRSCLRQAGVRYAFSYHGGVTQFDQWDCYDVRRSAVECDMSFDLFRARLALPQVFK